MLTCNYVFTVSREADAIPRRFADGIRKHVQQLKVVGMRSYLQNTDYSVVGVYNEVSVEQIRVRPSRKYGWTTHFPLCSHAMCLIAALPPETLVQLSIAFDRVLNVARTPVEVPTCIVLPSGENTAVVVHILTEHRYNK